LDERWNFLPTRASEFRVRPKFDGLRRTYRRSDQTAPAITAENITTRA
jgi:hypothetical protein